MDNRECKNELQDSILIDHANNNNFEKQNYKKSYSYIKRMQ